jgi:hypothetical protein
MLYADGRKTEFPNMVFFLISSILSIIYALKLLWYVYDGKA